jgi:hypothetical protein
VKIKRERNAGGLSAMSMPRKAAESGTAMTPSTDRSDREESVMPHTFDDAGGVRPCRETSSCEE